MIALLPRARIWNVEGRARGTNLGNGRFKFDFDKEEDLKMVLNKRPCHFNHWIFALERWEPSTSENFPNTIPFWIKITGVPVHLWNDGTFNEIAKALGKKEDIDAENARIQVSVDADRPLKMEARVQFPNGDVGKVHMTYEGLNRYCFECKRISHDIYSCPDLSPEEREQKRKELREQNLIEPEASSQQALTGPRGSNRGKPLNNKRPRSPSGAAYQRSPTQAAYPGYSRDGKRQRESDNYWTSKALTIRETHPKAMEKRREEKEGRYSRYQTKSTVWNRLEERADGHERRSSPANNPRQRQNPMEHQRGRESHRSEPYRPREKQYSHHSQASQQAWRPRAHTKEGKSCSPSRTVTNSKVHRPSPGEKEDSQRSISGGLQEHNDRSGQGNGVLVVHKNETSEERLRRLKGKAIMHDENAGITPRSRERGAVLIKESGVRSSPPTFRSVISPLRLRDESEEPGLELDTLMKSKQIDAVVMTKEDEEDVDKLVDEFGDVDMDDTMIQNDDLLGDEPGYEIIDAISQLSPANAVNKDKDATSKVATRPAQPASKDQMKGMSIGLPKTLQAGAKQGKISGTEDKKKSSQSVDLKGAQASKKLNVLRARPSPRKKNSGNPKKSNSNAVPRNEVFPSAKRTVSSFVSGSVVSQKPSSKKI
ncbi:hypothetical protein Bca52824_092955 [Brassica carinata]|uniref:DUF4283 domain-containing protein n=1 Tax=Brassica carinata TaxID=52824 RepID=A0A8X7TM75_BRACI|nr:hypothetical protein Bca52824_092955 [Brassica carinata]